MASGQNFQEQIATVLTSIIAKLEESHKLYAQFNVKDSVAIGEKAIHLASGLASIIDEGIVPVTQSNAYPAETQKDMIELRDYFVCLPIHIVNYVTKRAEPDYMKIIQSMKIMRDSWRTSAEAIRNKENDTTNNVSSTIGV